MRKDGQQDRGVGQDDKRFVGTRKYQISKIWDLHHEIVRRLVIGQKATDIAEDLGITEAVVSYTRNSAIVKRQLEIQHGARDAEVYEVNLEVTKLARKAVQTLEETIDNVNLPNLRFKAAVEVLDRVAPKIHRFEGVTARLSKEDISALTERATRAAMDAGLIACEA